VLTSSAGAYSQNSASSSQDPLLTACEKCADDRRALTAERDSLRLQLQLERERTELAIKQAGMERERAEFYKAAAEKRNDALAGNDLRVQIFREQQADDKAEILRLRGEIQRLRNPGLLARLFKPDTLTAAAAGFGICSLRK
jgi:hypothetical protein